jgi:two-component sensor histidine kinase/ligand-binding sensor domain-containing protein
MHQFYFCFKRSTLFCFFLFVISTGKAQLYDFVNYTVADGLTQSAVTSVFQDSRGYLWAGSMGGGVSRFDGINFQPFEERDGLAGQIVTEIIEDSTHNLWVGTTWGGVSCYDGLNFTNYGKSNKLITNEVSELAATKDHVFIGTDSILTIYSMKSKIFSVVPGTGGIRELLCDKKGVAWGICRKGFFRMEKNKPVWIDLPRTYNLTSCQMIELKNGMLLLALGTDLLMFNPSTATFSETTFTKQYAGHNVKCMLEDSHQEMWIAVDENKIIHHRKDGSTRSFSSSNGMNAVEITAMLEDNTGHIWIASSDAGLVKLRSESFTYYFNVPGLDAVNVFKIIEDRNGLFWFGSSSKGLWTYDGVQSQEVKNGTIPFIQPVAILENVNGDLWIGHLNGLTLLRNKKVVQQLLPGIRVRSLALSRSGTIWIGTWEKGLYKYDKGVLTSMNEPPYNFPSTYVHALHEDRVGNIWVGTGGGIVKYDGTTFQVFIDGLCNEYVGSIIEDKSGNIWFHTDKCVMKYDGKTMEQFDEGRGLNSNTVYLIQFDEAGNLWVGTNKGLNCMSFDQAGKITNVKQYGRGEGFRGIECNSRAVCLAKNGSIWFGTVLGVIRYNPNDDIPDQNEPRPVITGIRLFLEKTDWAYSGMPLMGWFHLPKQIQLQHNQNHLTFEYSGMHLNNTAATRYQFMLSGFDQDWQPVSGKTEITYSNLPPGEYVFLVKAANSQGVWNKEPVRSCLITILPPPPPFWKTWWFFLFATLVIGGVLFYLIVVRTRIIRRQKEELETEVQERIREISKQNEEKTLMLKEIHHRVKNNLQVISSLLNLQSDAISDPHVMSLFEDCRNRVNSMALIHQKMYQSKNLVNIDIRNYIDELLHSLIDAYDTSKTIRLITDIEEHPFSIDTIVPMGLILNEIISNSLKYAFEDRDSGELHVSLKKTTGNHFLLKISDNGKGMPVDFDLDAAQTLGLQLITMLSDQINGKVELKNYQGAHFAISFTEIVKERF